MTPYDPRAAALDALAAMRWPDVSEPPVEQVEVLEAYLRATHQIVRASLQGPVMLRASADAIAAAVEGRPLVPPA